MLEYTGSAAANAVLMSHILRGKKIIFVEGASDGNLLETIFCGIITAIPAKGCSGVLEAVDVIKRYNESSINKISMIGFIDIDYLHLKDDEKILERSEIIFTTYRDIEIDLIHSQALRRFLEEKAGSSKWDGELEVAKQLLNNLQEVSFLRAYNHAKDKKWDFKWITLSNYIDKLGCCDYSKLASAFRQKNGIKSSEWDQYIQWKGKTDISLKMITRGHDATCLLGIMLQGKLGKRKKEETEHVIIEENLRLAVERRFVETYQWFKKIFDWASEKSIQDPVKGARALT